MTGFNLTSSVSFALLCGAAAIFIGAIAAARWQQRTKEEEKKKQKRIPSKWRRVGEITDLFIYPLKSGQGVNLKEAECTDLGFRTTDDHPLKLRDRFLLVFSEETGSMKTARQHPNMVLIKVTSADENFITFEAPKMPSLKIKLPHRPQEDSEKKICTLWFDEKVEALDCGDEAAQWISKYLLKENSGVRMGYYATDAVTRRDLSKLRVSNDFKDYYKNLQAHDSGAYSDLATFMLMTQESVEEVKGRVARLPGLTPLWFRPNLVVRGSRAFAEDQWDWVRVGDEVVLRNVKPCTRCILTTINPETGIKDSNMEPLRTLKKYRKVTDPRGAKLEGDSPALGLLLGLRRGGSVRVGDPVYVGEE